MTDYRHVLSLVHTVISLLLLKPASSQNALPNIVLFMADDLGIGDVGVFGNTTLRTPNIDSIAEEGAKLSHHVTASSVCTPSRTAFLTGRYPIRSGMTPSHVVRVNLFVSSIGGLPPEEVTFAELAKEHGYRNGFIGKWHLGLHCSLNADFCHHPLNKGFDYFYGLPLTNLRDFGNGEDNVLEAKFKNINKLITLVVACLCGILTILWWVNIIRTTTFITLILLLCVPTQIFFWIFSNLKLLNGIVMRNHDVVEQPINLENMTQKLVSEGVSFIEDRYKKKEPFLLVMSWVQVHTALHASADFQGRSKHGAYGDNVEELDWGVGVILDALKKRGLDDNTFIYFSSDNGGHIEEKGLDGQREGGHNGIYRGGKGQGGSEGGIRVPTVVKWPGHVPKGIDIITPTSMMDIFPTLVNMWKGTLPTDRVIDGKTILPLLTEQDTSEVHDYLFHYCGVDVHAARYITKEFTCHHSKVISSESNILGESDQDVVADNSCKEMKVFKAHFKSYRWDNGTEGCGFMCDCYGHSVIHNDVPILYDLTADPAERHPLDVTLPKYKEILTKIEKAVDAHVGSIDPVPDQYAVHRMFPVPWLQPCCNFPKCFCSETK